MFPTERIAAIFSNVEQIYDFARAFLADLQKHIVTDEPEMSQIGTCFLSHVSPSLSAEIIILIVIIIRSRRRYEENDS